MHGKAVQIFELSNRIGGRLESVVLPGMNFAGELGGMRYLTSQVIATTLIEAVFKDSLQPVPFPMGNADTLLAYLRKQRLTQNAWTKAQSKGERLITRYGLNSDDVGLNADQLFNKIIYDVLVADPWFKKNYGHKVSHEHGTYDYTFQLTAKDWDAVKPTLKYCFAGPYQGRRVNDLGFWNLLKDRASQEGYTFLADAGGYFSNTINWNAAEAFPYMVGDFAADPVYKTIAGGYDRIAFAMARAYLRNTGARIWAKNSLIGFDRSMRPGFRYALRFYNAESNREWWVHANKIVLALPRRSLELLEQFNFFFNPQTQTQLQENIASVIVEPAFKILMGFEEPWWRSLGIESGHSITDLPLRQCYYFGTDPGNSHSMLLGSYNDMRTIPFWEVLDRHYRSGVLRNSWTPATEVQRFEPRATRLAAAADLQRLAHVQAPKLMVDELLNQLRELHGAQVAIPNPYVTWYKDWTLDPFGGGYHAWRAGYEIEKVMPYMRRPDPQEAIHICGEAYSDQQGWIEGAFCVTEKMLQEHFSLPWPTWLAKDYYLGW